MGRVTTKYGTAVVRLIQGDEIDTPRRPRVSDDEFMRWCEENKPCKYCGHKFVGPSCPRCE